ncbi:CD177 antigen-like isoform X2 [Myotis lucifugus]|uniref:CD177 antigen-like isoform X2 n=1 Tax=Myotis lucifugus TaxID=59463 RepID=UPI0006D73C69|nr:CD177 antigen-like isoform X2 [Myotis lucifugus]
MSFILLPALLGLTLMLPPMEALTCQAGIWETVRKTSEMPLSWTPEEESCKDGWGCQDSLMLIENGPEVFLELSKGCTQKADHEARITQHRKGPGLSVISYTHVCRHKNLCNDLSSTRPVWTLPPSAVPGSVRCPVCFAEEGCKSATEMTCPIGHTHCYNGVLHLRGVGIHTNLKVQGCMSQAACNLLNETQEIGALSVSEKCDSDGVKALTCEFGRLTIVRKASELPVRWTVGQESCKDGWGCQDSLMLIENGPQVFLALSKGCTQKEDHEARVTQHREGSGLSVISYTRVCRHKNFCNDLTSTDPVWTLPTSAVPGSVRCPVCFSEESCESATELTCPIGHTHCYNGTLQLRGVGIFTDLKVQGCMSQAACNLLNDTQEIGALSVSEKCNSDGVQALTCQAGTLRAVRKTSELPLEWTTGEEFCKDGWGCQDSLMLIENGPEVFLALIKGCTQKEDHEARVTQHRKGPGLSVVSYTRVCRHKNLCNDLSTSPPCLGPWPTSEGPGSVRCPVCFSEEDCKSATEMTCPIGHTHCYNGVLHLRGVGTFTDLKVQGCMSQAACNLLNETQEIGALSVSEKCDSDGVQALTCHSGSFSTVRNASELPLTWTFDEETCKEGWGCQDSLMLIENGPQVFLALSKGCTQKEDHEARITQHRKGPGLSVISYTRVCRHKNFCNDLSSTGPVWTLPPSAVLGSVRCPVCFAEDGCKSARELTCPVGHTHCYNGVLHLRGVGILGDLKVQGCMSQAACNLLNETQEIGALSVSEKCDSVGVPRQDGKAVPNLQSSAPLTCQKGVMLQIKENLTQNPLPWNTFSTVTCDLKEVCQETLLLIDVGPKSLMVGSKGCSKTEKKNSTTISIHSEPPGVLVASYARFCSSNGCNRATSSSVLLNTLPRPAAPAPGGLQCPACVQFGGSCSNSVNIMCPPGTTHCYNGYLNLKGGGLSAIFSIQGCMVQPSSSLLNHTKNIGQFFASEGPENEDAGDKVRQSGAVPVRCLAWVVGLGISLALWCGITSH